MSDLKDNLLKAAKIYINLGYSIGLTNKKTLVTQIDSKCDTNSNFYEFDGISIITENIVVIDIDDSSGMEFLKKNYELPDTFTEASPHGFHLFYGLPESYKYTARIKWKSKIDLLTKSYEEYLHKNSYNGSVFGNHVLVSPTQGYRNISYKNLIPKKIDLTPAPFWLIEAIKI